MKTLFVSKPPPAAHAGNRTRGFTLIELSIVLTIIGLIVGGIVAGKVLIHNAELRSILNDFTKFKTAISNFKLKYNAMPGDFSHATDVWGSAGGTGSVLDNNCYLMQTTTSMLTCNGNGSGTIGEGIINNQASYAEGFTGWKQMANAGLISYPLSGYTSSFRFAQPGINVPAGKMQGTGYTMYYAGVLNLGAANYFGNTTMQTVFVYGATDNWNHSYETYNPALTAAETQSLDSKVDDGMPGTGFYQSFNQGASSGCVSSNDPPTAQYSVATPGINCAVIYNTGM